MKKYMFGLLLGLAGCMGAETTSIPAPDPDTDDIVSEDDDYEYVPPYSAQNNPCAPYAEVLSVPWSDEKIVVLIYPKCEVPLFEDPGYPDPTNLVQPKVEDLAL